MENNNNKIITISFMVAGILVWIVTKVLIETAAGMVSGSVGRALNTDLAMEVMPVVIGMAVFLTLQFNRRVHGWADEVVGELKKIVWPSRKDTVAMTIVVCIMLVIAGFVVGGFDIISGYAIEALLNLQV